MNATIEGKKQPKVGDYVLGSDGALYQVRDLVRQKGRILADIALADGSDCPEGEEFQAVATLLSEEDERKSQAICKTVEDFTQLVADFA